jgi:hypothetical protein
LYFENRESGYCIILFFIANKDKNYILLFYNQNMKHKYSFIAIFIITFVAAGLIAIPAIEQANAVTAKVSLRDQITNKVNAFAKSVRDDAQKVRDSLVDNGVLPRSAIQ